MTTKNVENLLDQLKLDWNKSFNKFKEDFEKASLRSPSQILVNGIALEKLAMIDFSKKPQIKILPHNMEKMDQILVALNLYYGPAAVSKNKSYIEVNPQPLTKEDLIKFEKNLSQITEKQKMIFRSKRDDFLKEIKVLRKTNEDLYFRAEKQMQESFDSFSKQIDIILKEKIKTL